MLERAIEKLKHPKFLPLIEKIREDVTVVRSATKEETGDFDYPEKLTEIVLKALEDIDSDE